MPVVADSVEEPLCGKDDDAGDCNSVDIVKKSLVTGMYNDVSISRFSVSIDSLFPVTEDNDSGECD